MDKQKLMQFLSDAIDKGAHIHVHLGQFDKESNPIFKDEAQTFANRFKEACGLEVMGERENEDVCSNIFVGDAWEQFCGCFSHSPAGYMEEDIDLSGAEHVG